MRPEAEVRSPDGADERGELPEAQSSPAADSGPRAPDLGLAEWLGSRTPAVPESLRARMASIVRSHPEWNGLHLTEALLRAAEESLDRALHGDARSRDAALDLLAADAFVTYAFEAAADEPGSIVDRASDAMRRIARAAAAEH